MTAKEFLLQAWQIDARIEDKIAEIDRIQEKRERIMAKLTAGRASNLSGMPRGGTYDWTDSIEAVIEADELIRDYVQRVREEIKNLCRVKREVADAIDDVYARTRDIRYKRLLDLHYRNFLSWPEIAEKMGYDIRHVTRLHGEALLCVKVPKGYAEQ
jgi:hypothetical protein